MENNLISRKLQHHGPFTVINHLYTDAFLVPEGKAMNQRRIYMMQFQLSLKTLKKPGQFCAYVGPN